MASLLALMLVLAAAQPREPRQELVEQSPATPPPPSFALRVDPQLASKVNELLARVALHREAKLPAGETAEGYLKKLCGDHVPAYQVEKEAGSGPTKVRFAPCARVRRDVQVKAAAGDTLADLAARNGLPRAAATLLEVSPTRRTEKGRAKPGHLQAGDVVVIPEAPLLTHILTNPAVVADRAALVNMLAGQLGCDNEEPEACLTQRHVTVLDGATAPQPRPRPQPERPSPEPSEPPPPTEQPAFSLTLRESVRKLFDVLPGSAPSGIAAAPAAPLPPAAAAPASPPPPPPPAAMAAAPASTTIPVSLSQWPYDIELVAAILKADLGAGYLRTETTIGIADGGLGDWQGSPLPPGVFRKMAELVDAEKSDPVRQEPDGCDNDKDYIVDDLFGAGVERDLPDEILPTGDLGLCKGRQPPFGSWSSEPLRMASHGTVVATVAAALGLRQAAPELAEALPKLAFFRMVKNACTADTSLLGVGAAEMGKALEYLKSRSDVINLSYLIEGDAAGQHFANDARDILDPGVLLVVSAGDDQPGNLDRYPACPPCLGHKNADRGGAAARNTLVVGAATRGLQRDRHSNWGPETVGIFAPGEARDAHDLAGQPVPREEAATSYSAPLASLAAAIVRSFGGKNGPLDVKDRLMAATWPLDDSESHPEQTHVGVLDLVKAAAVRHDAVEVIEIENGERVRHTYVGQLLTPLRKLKLCQLGFDEADVHAVRLSDPVDNGERKLVIYHRYMPDTGTRRRSIEQLPTPCRPQGDLCIRTLNQGDKRFPLSTVTHIQLRWLL